MKKPEITIGESPLALDKIRIDGGTQMRADLNEDVVSEYAQTIRDGGDFPPVVVFFDGAKHWLADGFHRHFAYQRAGAVELPADVRKGSKRDAILYSVGANALHGLRRTNADKRRAVETLLKDKEWAAWSDREIARSCHVGHPLVASVRAELSGRNSRCDGSDGSPGGEVSEIRNVQRGGTTYQQDTSNIGKGRAPEQPEPPAGEPWNEQHQAAVPEAIRQSEAAREAAVARRREEAVAHDGLTDEQRIAELREHIAVVEAENAALKAENAKFDAMRVQFEQGGFEKVVAGKDEELRVAREQLALESADKVAWKGKANHWKKEAARLGWKADVKIVDAQTGALHDA